MVQSDSSKAPKSSVRDDAESRDRLWGMIKRHRFAMMATLHPGKTLRSRPMTDPSAGRLLSWGKPLNSAGGQ